MAEIIKKMKFYFSYRMLVGHCVRLLEFVPHLGAQWSEVLVSNQNQFPDAGRLTM